VLLLAEDADAVALEDDEDLLLGGVAVHRAVELARRDVRVVEPGFDRTRGRAEFARAVAELAAVEELGLDVLEADDVDAARELPASTKKISSWSPWEWSGVERQPGWMRMRFTPTPTVPAASPR